MYNDRIFLFEVLFLRTKLVIHTHNKIIIVMHVRVRKYLWYTVNNWVNRLLYVGLSRHYYNIMSIVPL